MALPHMSHAASEGQRELKDLQSVRVVIYGGEANAVEAEGNRQAKGAACWTGIHLELGNELAVGCEFH